MGRNVLAVLYILAMVGAVVGADLLFLRNHATLRLVVNVGIVVAFAAGYFLIIVRRKKRGNRQP